MLRTARSTVAVVAVVVVAGVATGGVAFAQLAPGTHATDGVAADASVQMTQNESAFLRAVHASPDAPNVDVYFDGEPILTDVAFGTVSDYLETTPGEHSFRVTVAGNESAVVYDENITLEAGQRYSGVALGEVSENGTVPFNVTLFEDATELPAEGNASVRVVHLSPDAPAVDVAVADTGDVLVENLSFGNASEYVTVPEGDYSLEVRPAGNDTAVATFDVSLDGETAYSTFAVGYLNPEEAPGDEEFDLVVATDLTAEMMAGTPTPGEETPGEETPTPGEEMVTETPTEADNESGAGY